MIKKYRAHIISFSLLVVLAPVLVFGQDFVPLSENPESLGFAEDGDMDAFLNRLFVLSIGVASVLAVIMIAIGGFKYMTSESVFNITGAKEQIFGAIVGLIIVLASIIILEQINPDIVNLNLFD